MSAIVPWPIYAGNLDSNDWDRIKRAKAASGVDFQVRPVVAVPGSPGRVLAIGSAPPFLCEFAGVDSTESPGFQAAVNWTLDQSIQDPRATTLAQQLSAIFGGTVRELEPEYLERKGPKFG